MEPTAFVEGFLRGYKLHLLAGSVVLPFSYQSLHEPPLRACFKLIKIRENKTPTCVCRDRSLGLATGPQTIVNDRFKPTVEMSTGTTALSDPSLWPVPHLNDTIEYPLTADRRCSGKMCSCKYGRSGYEDNSKYKHTCPHLSLYMQICLT